MEGVWRRFEGKTGVIFAFGAQNRVFGDRVSVVEPCEPWMPGRGGCSGRPSCWIEGREEIRFVVLALARNVRREEDGAAGAARGNGIRGKLYPKGAGISTDHLLVDTVRRFFPARL